MMIFWIFIRQIVCAFHDGYVAEKMAMAGSQRLWKSPLRLVRRGRREPLEELLGTGCRLFPDLFSLWIWTDKYALTSL
jgi:hypothetical protein